MPFPEQDPWAFTRLGIESLNPNQPGVYGLFTQGPRGAWVYLGQSGDLRIRLLQHLNGDNACINRNRPTKFVGEVVSGGEAARLRRERELIDELKPMCNVA